MLPFPTSTQRSSPRGISIDTIDAFSIVHETFKKNVLNVFSGSFFPTIKDPVRTVHVDPYFVL